MQAVESGSLYMTLDAFYKPVYLSMRGQGEEGFPYSVRTIRIIWNGSVRCWNGKEYIRREW